MACKLIWFWISWLFDWQLWCHCKICFFYNKKLFLWPIKMLPFVWRQNKPIRCREKLLIMAEVFSKVSRNNMHIFLVCFHIFPQTSKPCPLTNLVVVNKSCTVFCVSVLLLITDDAIKCSNLCSEKTCYAQKTVCDLLNIILYYITLQCSVV